MIKRSLIVLCVDRDNDLYEKVKISGPVIGREANLDAATKLALADPQETDANTMFEAIKTYDTLSNEYKEYNIAIATLTGDKRLGFSADKEVGNQLDALLSQFPADSCVFVSDGEADEEILPIVRSRLRVDSVKIVVMKQAKELEKTYFVLLEKLKDPYYARIVFGVPAVVILMLAIASYAQVGWQPVAMVVGLYLIAKGFGIDESVMRILSSFEFSVERISLVVYISAIPLIMISVWMGYQSYSTALSEGYETVKVIAYVLRSLLLLLPWAILLLIAGKIVDLLNEKRRFELSRYGLYAVSTVLLWLILSVASDWVLNISPPYVSFGDFIFTIVISVIIAFVSIEIMRSIRMDLLSKMNLEKKEVMNDNGGYVGKVVGVDGKNALLVIQTPLGQKMNVGFDSIVKAGKGWS